MASVDLRRVFLNDAFDPSDFASFAYVGDGYSVASEVGGGVRTGYGSGRSRSWSNADDVTAVQVTLHMTSPAQRDWLVAHRGRPVCFRDHLGHKVFGVYFSTPFTLSTLPPGHMGADNAVALALSSVTFDESV